jgi:ABC-2 type transport system ATP-binding protein
VIVATAQGLRKDYDGRTVLSAVDLTVAAGELLGCIGPNGGGKSTLLLLLAGLVSPTAGEVRVLGHPPGDRPGEVGLVTADAGLYSALTGRENLRFFAGLHGWDAARTDAAIAALLPRVALDPHAVDQPTAVWSSGTRQKAAYLRALLLRPRVLLVDEPTANVDPLAARSLLQLLRETADAGVAVVWATHDLAAAEALCDRVAVIAGTVRQVDTPTGPRVLPPPSPWLDWYRAHANPSAGSPL